MANRDFFRRLGLADEVAAPTLAKLRQPKTLRRLLLALGPIVVLADGLFAYTAGGRYVTTDNAYVHAGKLRQGVSYATGQGLACQISVAY